MGGKTLRFPLSSLDEDDEEMLPPHEMVARARARESPMTTFSVLEGAGRTLKGRDLRQVRNAVWRKTGFLDWPVPFAQASSLKIDSSDWFYMSGHLVVYIIDWWLGVNFSHTWKNVSVLLVLLNFRFRQLSCRYWDIWFGFRSMCIMRASVE